MIIVYPMLVSRAVSENSVPGIAKTIENYIIVHKQDMIINRFNEESKNRRGLIGRLLKVGPNLVLKEEDGLPPGATPTGHKKGPQQGQEETEEERLKRKRDELEKRRDYLEKRKKDKEDRNWELQKRQWDIEKRQLDAEERAAQKAAEAEAAAARSAKADVRVSDTKSITLEPTYITIEKTDKFGNKSSEFIGVKVVPIRVKSDVKLSHLILHDSKVKFLTALTLKIGRNIMRSFYRFLDKWTARLRLGGLTPSGDPRRDIITVSYTHLRAHET